jgi:hypothetical protein
MARLGLMMPAGARRALLDRRLKPGTVILLEVTFPTGTTKEKFLVLVASDADDLYFVINSNPSRLITRNPDLLRCQVTIDAASHPFLNYDSHIDCTQLLRLPRAKVLDDLVALPDRVKCTASANVLEQIAAAVKRAPTLSTREQTLIVEALTP